MIRPCAGAIRETKGKMMKKKSIRNQRKDRRE